MKKQMLVRVEEKMYEEFQEKLKKEGIKMTEFVETVIETYLEDRIFIARSVREKE